MTDRQREITKRLRRMRRRVRRAVQVLRAPATPPAARAAPVATAAAIEPGPLAAHLDLLPDRAVRKVVILADPTQAALPVWLRQFAPDDVHVVSAGIAPEREPGSPVHRSGRRAARVTQHVAADLQGTSDLLARIGPVDVLVDLLEADDSDHRAMVQRYFFHLAPGGVYVVARTGAAGAQFPTMLTNWLGTLPARDREYVASIGSVVITRDVSLLTKRTRHFLKVSHAEANRLLPEREPRLSVHLLDTLPPGEVQGTAIVTSHATDTEMPYFDTLRYPALDLRHYEGRIAMAGFGLFFTGNSVLPDSFRHYLQPARMNPRLTDVNPSFARIRAGVRPTETLAGTYYNLDGAWSYHFGHFLTEVLSRLWGWERAKAELPDLKAIVHLASRHPRVAIRDRRFLEAYGIDPDDIVFTTKPVVLNSLVSAMPMWHNAPPHYAHPGLIDVWDRLAAKLVDHDVPTHDKIFVSRGVHLTHRVCRNTPEVEALFVAHGFHVIRPEELDLAEQAALFAGARVIAGFGGSALFNIMYARKAEALVMLSHEAYTARNEHLYATLLGVDSHYFWSPTDRARVEGGDDSRLFTSSWEFDFERNRTALEALLRDLG